MEERGLTAQLPSKPRPMVSHFEEDRELYERRQRRSRLADDMLEDIADDLDAETDDAADEVTDVPLRSVTQISDEDEAPPIGRVIARTPIEMEDWGDAPEKLDEAEPEVGDAELE